MFKNLKIGVRLGLGFAVTLALLITIASVSYLRLSALNGEIDLLVSDKFPKTVQANNVIDAINKFKKCIPCHSFIITGPIALFLYPMKFGRDR